jgi:hypothetical protein
MSDLPPLDHRAEEAFKPIRSLPGTDAYWFLPSGEGRVVVDAEGDWLCEAVSEQHARWIAAALSEWHDAHPGVELP